MESSYFGSVLKDCLALVKAFHVFSVSFVRKSGNMAADFMANLAYSDPDHIWVEDVPKDLNYVPLMDFTP